MLVFGVVTCLVLTTVLSQAQETPSQPNGQPCDWCKKVISNLDMFLQKNTSEAEVEKLLRKICSVLPQSIEQMCEYAVLQYGPLFGKILLHELEPDRVCTALGLCTTNKPDVDSQEVSIAESVKVGDKCSLCALVIPRMAKALRNQYTLDAVQDALNNSCQPLSPTVSNVCQAMVSKYTTIVLEILMQQLQHQHVCSQLGLCNVSQAGSVNEIQLPSTSNIKCTLCKLVIDELRSLLSDNATQDDIKTAVEKVCDFLPSRFRKTCTNLIDKYAPQIFEMLLSVLTSDNTCSVLGFCSADVEVFVHEIQPPSADSIKCTVCTTVINIVKSQLSKQPTTEEVEKVLESICNFVPKILKSECKKFVDKYTSELIELLLSSVSAKDICKKLKLCKADGEDVEVFVHEIQPPSADSIKCTVCTTVINIVKSQLSKQPTTEEIEKVLESICNFVPKILKSECKKFVDKYTSELIKMLLSSVSAKDICKKLKLCKADGEDVEVFVHEIQPPSADSIKCTLCTKLINFVKSKLSPHPTAEEVENVLKSICNFAPKIMRSKCKKFIDKHLSELIEMLVASMSANNICKKLKMCKKDGEDVEVFVHEIQPPSADSIKCTLCTTVINIVKSQLSKQPTTEEVEKVLESICNFVPKILKSKCKKFVDKYTSELIKLLLSSVSAKDICKKLKLCKADGEDVEDESGPLMFMPENKELESMFEGEGKCELCKMLAEMIDNYIQKKKTVAEIEKILSQVCMFIPEVNRPQCLSVVMEYTPTLIELLSQLNNPTAVCEAVKICSRPSQETPYSFEFL